MPTHKFTWYFWKIIPTTFAGRSIYIYIYHSYRCCMLGCPCPLVLCCSTSSNNSHNLWLHYIFISVCASKIRPNGKRTDAVPEVWMFHRIATQSNKYINIEMITHKKYLMSDWVLRRERIKKLLHRNACVLNIRWSCIMNWLWSIWWLSRMPHVELSFLFSGSFDILCVCMGRSEVGQWMRRITAAFRWYHILPMCYLFHVPKPFVWYSTGCGWYCDQCNSMKQFLRYSKQFCIVVSNRKGNQINASTNHWRVSSSKQRNLIIINNKLRKTYYFAFEALVGLALVPCHLMCLSTCHNKFTMHIQRALCTRFAHKSRINVLYM